MSELTPIECKARLMGLSKVDRKDGEWTQLTFQVHPNDTPYALFLLPLKTHVMLSVKGIAPEATESAADSPETAPEEITHPKSPRSWDEVSPREQACIRCSDPEFGLWLVDYLHVPEDSGIAALVREYCRVGSRSDLNTNPAAAKNWADLDEEYQDHIGRRRSTEAETQLANGPS